MKNSYIYIILTAVSFLYSQFGQFHRRWSALLHRMPVQLRPQWQALPSVRVLIFHYLQIDRVNLAQITVERFGSDHLVLPS